jgi:hypothetical protein
MPKEKKPLFSDEYLTNLAEQINKQYGFERLENQINLDEDEIADPFDK